MCGIIGYIGKREVTPILVNGLKRLEYRGYDSAGVVVIDKKGSGHLERRVGKVAMLEHALATSDWGSASIGIAHTRWATHGEPSEKNAHPQSDCTNNFWVAHNGIVENYKELKDSLIAEGHKFNSETDTEVIAHLVEKFYHLSEEKNHKLMNAVRQTLRQIRGTYGIAVICKHEPDKIIAARNSSPLIIGVGTDENLIASDASAVINHTKNVIYLNDGDIAEVKADSYRIETVGGNGEEMAGKVEEIEWDGDKIEKGGHEHFMHKEIFEIPEVIENSIRGRLILAEGRAKLGGIEDHKDELRGIERIIAVACGTAHAATRVAEYMIEEYAGVPTEVDIASEFRYRKPVFTANNLLLAISQSGETADTLAAVKEAKEKGVMTMGIVNAVGSSVARETGFGVYNHAGPEISVASTKAFISQLVISALFTLFLGRQREMSLVMGQRIGEALKELPELVRRILGTESEIIKIAKKYKDAKNFLALGRKYNAPIATEIAI
jgi:glucosamine--fructose-6-phosphate aminotransferase (isomerizing)